MTMPRDTAGEIRQAQFGAAMRLAAELEQCGHDLSALDLLDALASTRLVLLTPTSGNLAAEAYAAALADRG